MDWMRLGMGCDTCWSGGLTGRGCIAFDLLDVLAKADRSDHPSKEDDGESR